MESIVQILKKKHGGDYADFKLKVWAKMLVSAVYYVDTYMAVAFKLYIIYVLERCTICTIFGYPGFKVDLLNIFSDNCTFDYCRKIVYFMNYALRSLLQCFFYVV